MKNIFSLFISIFMGLAALGQSNLASVSPSDSSEYNKISRILNKLKPKDDRLKFFGGSGAIDGQGNFLVVMPRAVRIKKKDVIEYSIGNMGPQGIKAQNGFSIGKGKNITTINIFFDTCIHKFVAHGFYSDSITSLNRKEKLNDGIYTAEIELPSLSFIYKIYSFSPETMTEGNLPPNLKIMVPPNGKGVICSNNGYYFLYEESLERGEQSNGRMTGTNGTLSSTLLLHVSKEGKSIYSTIIKKEQYIYDSNDTSGVYFSYNFVVENKQYVIYNDNTKNYAEEKKDIEAFIPGGDNRCLVLASVSEGKIEKQIIVEYKKKEASCCVMKGVQLNGSKEIIFPKTDKTYIKVKLN